MRDFLLAATAASAALAWFCPPSASAGDPFELVRAAVRLPCLAAPGTGLASLSNQLAGAHSTRNWVRYSSQGIVGKQLEFAVTGDELEVEFAGAVGRPDYVTALYLAGATRLPRLFARADHSCTIHTARLLTHDLQGRPEWLQVLDDRLLPVGQPEPLNPPVPTGRNPSGILIGVVDSGVNYLLPEIAARLARDPDGRILGYDYWDLDGRPFDVEPTSDPFFPDRHGTRIASILIEAAPVAKLVPYRYPRLVMTRMAALIEDAASHDVQLMNLSLATANRDEWLAFENAARAHPEMLFVVAAGNHSRDLQRDPTYPASLNLDNMLVVTSASADGRLTPGVNFGSPSVDLMAPGEDVVVLDFDGERRPVSGSSYATARVTAFAACLLAEHPEWAAAALKTAVLQAAESSVAPEVRHGFLAPEVLGNRGACAMTLADCHGPNPRC